MKSRSLLDDYTRETFCREAAELLDLIRRQPGIRTARSAMYKSVTEDQFRLSRWSDPSQHTPRLIARDCARAWRGMLRTRADERAGFSVITALWDIAHDRPRPDLGPPFYAEMINLVRGVSGRVRTSPPDDGGFDGTCAGRDAALQRSTALDRSWQSASEAMDRIQDGCSAPSLERRRSRRAHLMRCLNATDAEWADWQWHTRNVVKDPDLLAKLVELSADEAKAVRAAVDHRLPFGVTPYYLSLMDDDISSPYNRAIRAQVFPPASYVETMTAARMDGNDACDFMLERDTSPIDLVTRRYPAIAILKPFNTCPQICVYCQRNWEIADAMLPEALAPFETIEAACRWIEEHPAIIELLVTGGDPLAMSDDQLGRVLERVSRIPHIEVIRIGTRTPVTLPMRITEALAARLGDLRQPGRREVCVVTHVEHPTEVTPDFVQAIDRLRRHGMAVYNQLVFTYFVSRRFEAAKLRRLLKLSGVDPYYTFATKGKDELRAYRVPLARLLQEQDEESRLLPGLRRTDEAVYNVPGLGKNHLRGSHSRDLLSILPDGSRVYEFHPWEKPIGNAEPYVGTIVPIYEYLARLSADGDDPADYESIWYYF